MTASHRDKCIDTPEKIMYNNSIQKYWLLKRRRAKCGFLPHPPGSLPAGKAGLEIQERYRDKFGTEVPSIEINARQRRAWRYTNEKDKYF